MDTSSESSNLMSVVLATPTRRNELRPRIDSSASGTGEDIKRPGDLHGRLATKVIPRNPGGKRVSVSALVGGAW